MHPRRVSSSVYLRSMPCWSVPRHYPVLDGIGSVNGDLFSTGFRNVISVVDSHVLTRPVTTVSLTGKSQMNTE